jgi:hypothetical protein
MIAVFASLEGGFELFILKNEVSYPRDSHRLQVGTNEFRQAPISASDNVWRGDRDERKVSERANQD